MSPSQVIPHLFACFVLCDSPVQCLGQFMDAAGNDRAGLLIHGGLLG
jgi:hypothetical protein